MSKNKSIIVNARITKDTVMQCVRDMTIHNIEFNAKYWAEWDAETFEDAARMIRRELKLKNKKKGKTNV